MRQDKDRSGKWLLTHHGDAILRLGGITGFTAWKALQAETIAPRRLPDGLIEVRFPGEAEPTLVLVEIETYPDSDADRQVLDDLMLIAVDRKTVPEVVSLVLKPKGNLTVTGASERTSPRGRTKLGGLWPVVRLWELDAESLLNSPDVGLIPWAPLARTTLEPDELMTRCRDRLVQVPDANDQAGLLAVTGILAGLAFPGRSFNLFGGSKMLSNVIATAILESPALQEVMKDVIREQVRTGLRAETLREGTLAELNTRFGSVPAECETTLNALTDETRLKALLRLAVTCPDLATFVAGLTTAQ
jgi:hypothetical protein